MDNPRTNIRQAQRLHALQAPKLSGALSLEEHLNAFGDALDSGRIKYRKSIPLRRWLDAPASYLDEYLEHLP